MLDAAGSVPVAEDAASDRAASGDPAAPADLAALPGPAACGVLAALFAGAGGCAQPSWSFVGEDGLGREAADLLTAARGAGALVPTRGTCSEAGGREKSFPASMINPDSDSAEGPEIVLPGAWGVATRARSWSARSGPCRATAMTMASTTAAPAAPRRVAVRNDDGRAWSRDDASLIAIVGTRVPQTRFDRATDSPAPAHIARRRGWRPWRARTVQARSGPALRVPR